MYATHAFGHFSITGKVDPRAPLTRRILDTVKLWFARAAERRQLKQLDDRLLADIGLDRQDALTEAAKPFWKA